MAVITATSDFGSKDPNIAIAQAHFIRRVKDLQWVNISHAIEPHNILQAAFVLKRAYTSFPPGSIHIMYVGGAPRNGLEYICIKADGQFFLAPNNGILASVLDQAKISAASILDIRGIDPMDVNGLFASAAAHLAEGGKVDLLGPSLTKLKKLKTSSPQIDEYAIRGNVIYIDHHGTCVTNIHRTLIEAHKQDRRISIETPRNRSISVIHERIGEVPQGKIAGVWDAQGMLCIAVGVSGGEHIKGSNELLGLNINDWVRIDFE